VAPVTPWPKMGWSDHPIFGKGVARATPISFFFLKKKKKFLFLKKIKNKKRRKTKILKLAKLCRFGLNDIVLGSHKIA
jgi:hypothetical protein